MLGFLGGTGPEGRGLALRLALAGQEVLLGSRDANRAKEAVERIEKRAQVSNIRPVTNDSVAREADIVFLTVPFEAQSGLLGPLAEVLAGKVVVSTVAPVVFQEGHATAIPVPEGSAAAQAQRLLYRSKVVAAFQNVSAVDLWVPRRVIEGDVVVCSDHPEAKEEVMRLVPYVPRLRAVDGGTLANARYVEEITALLLNINRIHSARTMIRIVGLESVARAEGS